MHSPFVFDFIQNVLNNRKNYKPPSAIEFLRKELRKDDTVIEVKDLGAGSRKENAHKKKISKITATAVKPKKYGQFLYRLCSHYQPQTILELGTSLGITTAYLASANQRADVTTIEGSPAIADLAQQNFHKLGLQNITAVTGNFDDVLPKIVSQKSFVDLFYCDGNHLYSPTINYFRTLFEKAHHDSIFVFDDIHWSAEMERAWEEIKSHPSVQYTIDVFFLGFVFFRREFKVKQHFKIRY